MPGATRFYEAFSQKRLCFRSEGAGGAGGSRHPLAGPRVTGTAGCGRGGPGLVLQELLLAGGSETPCDDGAGSDVPCAGWALPISGCIFICIGKQCRIPVPSPAAPEPAF